MGRQSTPSLKQTLPAQLGGISEQLELGMSPAILAGSFCLVISSPATLDGVGIATCSIPVLPSFWEKGNMASPSGTACPCAKRKKLLCLGSTRGDFVESRDIPLQKSLSGSSHATLQPVVRSAAETQSEIGAVRHLHQNYMVIVEVQT